MLFLVRDKISYSLRIQVEKNIMQNHTSNIFTQINNMLWAKYQVFRRPTGLIFEEIRKKYKITFDI